MKRFLITILIFVSIPLLILLCVYLWTDPFRCIHAFDINDVDDTNREYLSTELFLRNNPVYHYNSFIFASSRGGGMNTYHWKQHLPEGSQPFLFQAWTESVTGIYMKISYLSKQHVPLDNVLILLDIPSSFEDQFQSPKAVLSMKHYLFTGHTKLYYNTVQYSNFIQKPSLWLSSIKKKVKSIHTVCEADTITNDWVASNKYNYTTLPPQDSLKQCSEMTKQTFLAQVEHSNGIVKVSEPLITSLYEERLKHIKILLEENQSDYHVILTPGFCYTELSANPKDVALLQEIFGIDRVHDYTGENEWTTDYNNYSDPKHFGLRVGYMIIDDIYRK